MDYYRAICEAAEIDDMDEVCRLARERELEPYRQAVRDAQEAVNSVDEDFSASCMRKYRAKAEVAVRERLARVTRELEEKEAELLRTLTWNKSGRYSG